MSFIEEIGIQRDAFSKTHEGQRDGFGKTREGQRDEWRKIRGVREDGFVQISKRKT